MNAYIVDAAALRGNVRALQKRAGDAELWCVLKANAYGLGLLPMAKLLSECGVNRFAVTRCEEVQALRNAGYTEAHILMLRPTNDAQEIRRLIELGAILTVSSQDDAAVVNGVAAQLHTVCEAHIKIDTGMGRYGFHPNEVDKLLPVYGYMDGIAVSGIYSHFHSAFCSKKATAEQFARFQSVLKAITDAGYETGTPHICNSTALLRFPEYRLGGVRVGSALLGRFACKDSFGLSRIGHAEASVDELRWLSAGQSTGYGAAWKAKKPTRIAVLPIGYYHGFGCKIGDDLFGLRDRLRSAAHAVKSLLFYHPLTVTLNGKKCRVLGHVGMLHTVIDVTNCPCSLGDRAVLDFNPILLRGMDIIYKE